MGFGGFTSEYSINWDNYFNDSTLSDSELTAREKLKKYIIDNNIPHKFLDDGSLEIGFVSDDDVILIDDTQVSVESSEPATIEINTNTGTDLLSVLRENSINTNSHLKRQNELLKNKNDLIKEQNKLIHLNNKLLKQSSTKLDTLSTSTLAVSNSILEQTERSEFHNNYFTAKNIMDYQKNDLALNGNDSLTDENGKKIIPSFEEAKFYKKSQDHQVNIENHNTKVQDHQNKIDEKNEKVKEHLDFQKDGDSSLKDSENKRISPRAVKANYHAEKHIDELKANKFNWTSVLDDDYDKDDNNESIDYDIMSKVISDIYNNIKDDDIPNNLKEEV